MRAPLAPALLLFAACASPVCAQALYRCQDGGRVTYSDRACATGTPTAVRVDTMPSTGDRTAAAARLRQDLADFDARWAARGNGRTTPRDAAAKAALQARGRADAADSDGRCEPRMIGATPQVPATPASVYMSSVSRRR